MPKLSVIIPVYNAENFVSAAIDSVLSQTFSDFELILVDDGSTDSSPEICNEYSKKDSRVKVVHQKNGGAGKARNTGIEKSSGEWIDFLDSDDWLEKETFAEVFKIIQQQEVDSIVWNCVHEFRSHSVKGKSRGNGLVLNPNADGVVWNKIYRSEIIKSDEIKFPVETNLMEDGFFNFLYFARAKKFFYCGKYFYHSRKNSASLTHSATREMIIQEAEFFEKSKNLIIEKGSTEDFENFRRAIKQQCLWLLKKPDFDLFRKIFPEMKFGDLVTKEYSIFGRFYIFLILHKLDFFAFVYDALKKKLKGNIMRV